MSATPPDAVDRLAELTAEIERTERAAIGMAMTGQWTAEQDATLAALHEERRALTHSR